MLGRFRYQSIRNGLVGHWRPSRGCTGNTLIDSVRGNHGTLVNGPTWQASGSGLALSFDGVDDYVSLPRIATLFATNTWTVRFWLRTTQTTTNVVFFSAGSSTDNSPLFLVTSGISDASKCSARLRDDGLGQVEALSSQNINDGAWHQISVTCSTASLSLYIDANAAAVTTVGSLPRSVNLVTVGAVGRAAYSSFSSGVHDDLSVFSRTLTPSEILTLYTAGRGALDQRVNVSVVRGYDPGVTGIEATLNITDGADTLAATSTVSLSALLTATDGSDSLSATSSVSIAATLTQVDGSDTLSATATVASQATLSATDGTDTLSATATVQASASLTSTDGSDTLAASATVSISASASVTDSADTLEFTAVGVAQASAVLNATDGADSLSATATVGVSSTLSQTDGSDSLSASATVSVSASLTSTDGADLLAFTATSGSSVIGGIYLGQVVCYPQTVVVNRTTVRAY